MQVNLRGRVRNIKLTQSHGLHPLFEAVVNAIHAIEERGCGAIDVHLRRDHSQHLLNPDDITPQPITGFEIHDTGIIGFDKLIVDAKKRNAILFDKLGVGTL